MALKSLEEINREFIFERLSYGGNPKPTSTTPYIELPNTTSVARWRDMKTSAIKMKMKLANLKSITSKRLYYDEEKVVDTVLPKQKATKKKTSAASLVSDILFYIAIFVILSATIFAGSDSKAPKVILGYSYFTVLTSSMQNEIPKGSFILVHHMNPSKLKLGDNITYMRDPHTSITHKIVGIYENYQNSGARGFQTQGVNNVNPDQEIVFASNVVGKVTIVIPSAGAAIMYLRTNMHLMFIMFGLCVILSFTLRGMFTKPGRGGVQGRVKALAKR
ncbi:MAG: signal peptidase I [Firmicutes bacterium]|nr:signal peptidase I [Bacillota bacterium]